VDDQNTTRYNGTMKDTYYAVKFQLWMAPHMRDNLHAVAKTQNMKAAELVRRLILNYFDQLDGVSTNVNEERLRGQD
jgi:hypothetical protein